MAKFYLRESARREILADVSHMLHKAGRPMSTADRDKALEELSKGQPLPANGAFPMMFPIELSCGAAIQVPATAVIVDLKAVSIERAPPSLLVTN